MPEQKNTRFSFTQTAAPTQRQRFSFASPRSQTTTQQTNTLFGDFSAVGKTSQSTPQKLDKPYDLSGPAKAVGSFAQGIAQDIPSSIATVSKKLGFTDPDFTFKPKTKFEQTVFGKEPFSFEKTSKELAPLLEDKVGLSSEKTERFGPLTLAGLTALDFVTVPGKKAALIKALKNTAKSEDAVKVLRNAGVDDEVIFGLKLGEEAAGLTDSKELGRLLDEAAKSTTYIKEQRAAENLASAPKRFTVDNPPTPNPDEEVVYFTKTGGDKQFVATSRKVAEDFGDDIDVGVVKKTELKKTGNSQKDDAGIRLLERDVADRTYQANRLVDEVKPLTPDDISQLPKIERRFVDNFPELGSAERLSEIQSRTRGVRSNEESLAAAQQLGYTEDRLLRIPEGKALNAEEKMAVSGVVENARLTLGKMEDQLSKLTPGSPEANSLREAIATQKVKTFKLMAVERGAAAEAGRALQAHKAAVTAIEQQERWLAKYLADPKVSQDLKDYIYKRVGEFNGTPNEMSKLLRELNQASLIEMLVEYATAVKLWATQTHIVNMLSSATRMLLNSPLHGISAVFNKTISKLSGKEQERFISDAFAEIQGQMEGWKHAGHEAAKALKDESYAFEARKLQDVQPKGPAIKGRPGKNELSDKIMDGFGKVVRTPFRLLGVEDLLIRKPSEMGALYTSINRSARMKGIKPGTKEWNDYVSESILNPSLETMQEVQKIADGNLFQESLHPVLKRMSDWREDFPPLKLVVPFFRTIVNLQKQAIEFSVLAPALPSARRALKAGGGAQSDALAKMTLGTAVTLPLVYHGLEGNITLAAPTNPSERDAFYAEGKQPYSVKLGNKWYPYHRFSPYSEWFVTAGAFAEAVNNDDEKSQSELAAHVFFTMTQNFFDKSFATGMHDLLEALSNPERADKWVQNFVTGATIPNFIPLAARTVDPVVRETQDLRDAYISKVPYWSKTLPARTDVFGGPITRPGSAIERAISPVIPSPIEVDLVRSELDLIGYKMGFPGKTAGGFEMDDDTYRIFQAASGKITYKALFQLMQTPEYQELAPIQREKVVRKIVDSVRDKVKQSVASEQIIMQQIKTELKNQGYSSSQAEDLAVKTYEIIKRKQQASQSQ